MSRDRPIFAPGRLPEQRPGRAGSKRERNRSERTQKLCEAALRLFLERGLEPVTIDEITKAAGVAKGSFYRYFDDKEQLVQALFAPLSDSVRTALERATISVAAARSALELAQAYEHLAFDLVSSLLPERHLVRLYLQECRGPAQGARAAVRALSCEVAARAVELTRAAHDGGLLRDLPPEVTALAVVGAVESLLFQYFEGTDIGEPVAASRALVLMVLEGLRRPVRGSDLQS